MHFLFILSLLSLLTLPACDWFSKKSDKVESCGCHSSATPEECAQECDAQNADQPTDMDPMVDGARMDDATYSDKQ